MEALVQKSIDFGRAEQLGLLRDAVLDPARSRDGKTVSPAIQKGVLRVIDDHGGGREAWLGYETIAREANISIRTAKRAVECLMAASLLCVETRRSTSGAVCNHYIVVWNELSVRCQCRRTAQNVPAVPKPQPVPLPVATCGANAVRSGALVREVIVAGEGPDRSSQTPDRSALGTDRSALGTDRSALGTKRSAPGGTQSALKRIEAQPPPPPTPSQCADDEDADWAAVAGKWITRIALVRSLLDQARAAGRTPESCDEDLALLWSIAASPANDGILHSPGAAVVFRWRTGAWPADGVIEDQAARTRMDSACARRAAQRQDEAIAAQQGREDFDASRLIRQSRAAGMSDREIAPLLEARGLGAAGRRLGWLDC